METYGRYQLLKKLATGGMAEIWLARQVSVEGFEKVLVVKRILPHLAENEEFVQMFLDEARIAARLNHPNVVQIFDLGEQEGTFYIAMEYIHGEDVRRVWKQADAQAKPLPVPIACRVVMDAAAALDYAHKRTDPATGKPLGIIHRDVSPQNILVGYEGGVKLVDFGIAKAADSAGHTRSGVLKGKYSYMSPEQAAGKKIDHRTDVFALGVVLYELLAGARLFKRPTEIETLRAVTECQVEPPSAINPRVPPDLDEVVLKALRPTPDQRFSEAAAIQVALEDWLMQHRLPSSSAHVKTFMQDIYRDRLAEEARLGRPLWEEISASQSSLDRPRQPTGVTAKARGGAAPSPGAADATAQAAPRPLGAAEPAAPEPQTKSDLGHGGRYWVRNALIASLVLGAGGVVAGLWVRGDDAGRAARPAGGVARLGVVKIETTPSGASVFFDSRRLGDTAPLTIPEVPRGEHTVFVQKDGFKDASRTFQLDGDIVTIALALEQDTGAAKAEVAIATEPPGAEVIVDGRSHGSAPVTLKRVAGKTIQLQFELRGYVPLHRSVELSAGRQELSFALERQGGEMGTVQLTSEIPATVYLGKRSLGRTPLTERFPPGRYSFALLNRDLALEETLVVNVRAGQPTKEHIGRRLGWVRFMVDPWAEVYLGDRRLGQTPFGKMPIAEGEHTFTFKNPELKKVKTQKATVAAGAEITVVQVSLKQP